MNKYMFVLVSTEMTSDTAFSIEELNLSDTAMFYCAYEITCSPCHPIQSIDY